MTVGRPLEQMIHGLRVDVPLLLLPVRIETAFGGTDAKPTLRARIVPDDIHLASDAPGTVSTRLLPERFAVHVRVGAHRLRAETAPLADRLDIDPKSRWLTDFTEAVRVGLAVELSLPPRTNRIDDVTVIGISAATPAEAVRRLQLHLAQAAKAGGVELLAEGTPTNNTAATRAGSPATSAPATVGSTDKTEGRALALVLGLPAAGFDAVPGAGRPAGPRSLPALRVGRQPYGVLVTAGATARVGAAESRLAELRSRTPSGLQLGAWASTGGFERRSGPRGSGAGFVLAPTPHHAVTAAVLRGAWFANGSETFAISLAGQRGQMALRLARALRSGRSLGDVLGSQIERALLDAGRTDPSAAALVSVLRRRFPLGDRPGPARCDGLAMAELYAAVGAGVGSPLHRALQGGARADADIAQRAAAALAGAMDLAVAAVDALADLALAESVHQFVAGRYERAGAAADLLTPGTLDAGGPPDRFEVLEDAIDGIVITQRVVLALPDVARLLRPTRWVADSPRALLAPTIDACVAAGLGEPDSIRFVAHDAAGNEVARRSALDLGLCALDLAADASLALVTRLMREALTSDQRAVVAAVQVADEDSRARLTTARAWHRALATRRPLAPGDVLGTAPEQRHEVVAGATAVIETFRVMAATFPAASPRWLAAFGVLPEEGSATVATRLADVDRLRATDPAGAVRACFGGEVILEGTVTGVSLPAVAPSSPTVPRWLGDVREVRDAVDRMAAVLPALPSTVAGERATQHPAAPYLQGATQPNAWVGGAFGGTLAGPVTSTVVLGCGNPPPQTGAATYSGVLVDEWVELVPQTTTTGAVAIHVAAPNSRAPHALLLAVPTSTGPWSEADVLQVVDDAMRRARERAAAAGDPRADLDELLSARVRDPLWFLARQVQLGELSGEDAGWPVSADVELAYRTFTDGDITSIAAGWSPTQLTHRATVRSGRADVATVTADDAAEVDRSAYVIATGSGARVATTRQSALPTPVRFAGMPAARYWEMEDPRLSLAAISVGDPGDDLAVGRAALIEFATIFGNDWFSVPVTLTRGGLTEVTRVTVTDSFGRAEVIAPAAAGWDLFGPTGGLLVVPPAPPSSSIVGPITATVAFIVDETANVVWAVDELDAAAVPAPDPIASGARPMFRVAPEVSDRWHPFVARAADGDHLTVSTPAGALAGGQLLAEFAAHGVARSALGETGSTVRLRRVMARGPRGERHRWWAHAVEHVPPALRRSTGFDTVT